MAKLKKQLLEELNKLKTKLVARNVLIGTLVLCVVVSLVGVALAKDSFSWLRVEKDVADQLADAALRGDDDFEPPLGAGVGPFTNDPIQCNLGECTGYSVGDLIDASTTIFAALNPFRAATTTADQVVVEDWGRVGYMAPTATVDLVRLNITGAATTTYSVFCAAAETQYATSTVNNTILVTGTSVTSTPILENNMTAAQANGGYATESTAKIMITPEAPWVICKVNASNAAAFTGGNNTFDGDAVVRWHRLQR